MKKYIKRTLMGIGMGVALWFGSVCFTDGMYTYYAREVGNYAAGVNIIESIKEDDQKRLERYKLAIPCFERQAKLAEEQGNKKLAEEYRKEAADYQRKKEMLEETLSDNTWDQILERTKTQLKYSKAKKTKWKNIADIINPF